MSPSRNPDPDFFAEHAEFVRIADCPAVDAGGYLEEKNGEACLREADQFEVLPGGRLRVVRRWRRGKFDPELYTPKREGQP